MTEETLGKIGKYELLELIGEGAMGKVYRALDPVLGRNVAIKLMSATIANDAHLRDRFLREARAAANLQHPNIITIYDFGETDGHPFIAMEFVDGTDLAHLIEQREPLSLDSKVSLLVGLLNGLAYAHAKGVVHRDIKPANIRVTPDGRVKIMDFGIAHLSGSEITHSGAVLGTPDYMAPEQVRGLPVTAATDIFAAGAVLYELLTYEKPFTGETLHAVLFKVVTENPRGVCDINPSLPENLQRIVETALNKEPGQRYPTADAMAADLSSARTSLTGIETVATLRFNKPLDLGFPALGWWNQKKARYAAGGAAAAVLLVAGWAIFNRGAPPAAQPAPAVAVASDTTSQLGGTTTVLSDSSRPDTAAQVTAPAAITRPVAQPAAAARTEARPARVAPPPASPARELGNASPSTRAQIEREVLKLERAISTGQTIEIIRVMPGLTKEAQKGWDDFFKNKRDFKAELQVGRVDYQAAAGVKGPTVTARISARYTYIDTRSDKPGELPDLTYVAVLQRENDVWAWKEFK